ncbi:MvaI/BcnI family restriction endonuclease [Sedimentisphaera salicampi]|uniref:MvaI/BcnI family restriction endonuclease n=1 Tax=Sedimentisphaera salicampi TaxID=1941349 RepID=UPI000B9A72DA|nr:MvaI/BcnI family restriction endonuclease [Sedimentisphaera salicampi]OXU14802.1 hypothetical protein SMSP1_01297 [Sedimentisphaera salicampi]
MIEYTKESLINKLKEIKNQGWVANRRHGNSGGVGNTLEDLLGVEENNLPIPNAAEWELKTRSVKSSSLTTIFHMEPSPRAFRFVPKILLPNYGWKHEQAGSKYSENEMSFRQTIRGGAVTNRGFSFEIDKAEQKVVVKFNLDAIAPEHAEWKASILKRNVDKGLNPAPYWGFEDLGHKAGSKLNNCFYVVADEKKIGNRKHFWYKKIMMLKSFSVKKFIDTLDSGYVFIDFDARTGHNHGTKFRLKQEYLPCLYEEVKEF